MDLQCPSSFMSLLQSLEPELAGPTRRPRTQRPAASPPRGPSNYWLRTSMV